MPNNVEAFDALGAAIDERGRPFTEEQVYVEPIGDPNAVVAYGLETQAPVEHVYNKLTVAGTLSVRGLRAVQGQEATVPFNIDREGVPSLWLVRTRLDFTVPPNDLSIQDGDHTSAAVYFLHENEPRHLDDAQTPGGTGTLELAYFEYPQQLPDMGAVSIGNPNSPRAQLLEDWYETSAEADGMAMLSTTSFGEVNTTELPRTISWLLENM